VQAEQAIGVTARVKADGPAEAGWRHPGFSLLGGSTLKTYARFAPSVTLVAVSPKLEVTMDLVYDFLHEPI